MLYLTHTISNGWIEYESRHLTLSIKAPSVSEPFGSF